MKPSITVGADPELFLGSGDGLKSAIDRIGGWKTAPRGLSRPGFFVQEDNVAVEFNIPPATSAKEFAESIQWAVKEIEKEVQGMNLELKFQASAVFPKSELLDPRALAFGCDPDYNAWRGGQVNPKPVAPNADLRSCGGHIHVGYHLDTSIDRLRLIQLMDLYLGVPAVLMDTLPGAQERRQLYGKAGAYRPTDYGVEYRVLSNFWITQPKWSEWAFEQTQRAFDKALEYGPVRPIAGPNRDVYHLFMERNDLCDEIQDCINTGDPILAQKLMAHHELSVVV